MSKQTKSLEHINAGHFVSKLNTIVSVSSTCFISVPSTCFFPMAIKRGNRSRNMSAWVKAVQMARLDLQCKTPAKKGTPLHFKAVLYHRLLKKGQLLPCTNSESNTSQADQVCLADSMRHTHNEVSQVPNHLEQRVTMLLRLWYTQGRVTALYPVDTFPQICYPMSKHLFEDQFFKKRLGLACLEIEHAVGFCKLKNSNQSLQADHVRTRLDEYYPISGNFQAPSFLVAGGWIVDRVFGFGPSSDMDVWFAPKYSGPKGSWILCCSKSCYKVNTLMVASPWDAVESFDLHVCQCAIECSILNGQRLYRLWLTPACLLCVLQRLSHSCNIHPCVSQPERLLYRIQKYRNRGLRMKWEQRERSNSGVAVSQFCGIRWSKGFGPGHWKIRATAHHIRGIELSCDPLPPAIDLTLQSLPLIVYPCRSEICISELNFSKTETHWLLRGLAGAMEMVGLCGSGRVDARLIKPIWLFERKHLTEEQLIADMMKHLPYETTNDNHIIFYLASAYELHPQFMMVDWSHVHPEADWYDNLWSYTLICQSQILEAQMFCDHTLAFEDHCCHGRNSQNFHLCASMPRWLHSNQSDDSSDYDNYFSHSE